MTVYMVVHTTLTVPVCLGHTVPGTVAKVGAMLLHPRRHPWKVLMRAAFARHVPSLGAAVLVSRLQPRRSERRLERHVGYWKAFHDLKPHRLLPAADWPVWHMLHEAAASNCQLAPQSAPAGLLASGSRLKSFAAACALPAGQPVTLGCIRQAVLGGGAGARRLGGRLLNLVRPLPWREVLAGHEHSGLPEPEWWVSGCGSWVRKDVAGPVYRVRSDGRLDNGPMPEAGQPQGWLPAAVCWCPVLRGQELLANLPPPAYIRPAAEEKLQPYLLLGPLARGGGGPQHVAAGPPASVAVHGAPCFAAAAAVAAQGGRRCFQCGGWSQAAIVG